MGEIKRRRGGCSQPGCPPGAQYFCALLCPRQALWTPCIQTMPTRAGSVNWGQWEASCSLASVFSPKEPLSPQTQGCPF